MKTTINTMINGQLVPVEVAISEVLYAACVVENELKEQTKNIMVVCNDAYHFVNGHHEPAIGIRMMDKDTGREKMALIGDTHFLIAGTLRRSDNGEEIIRLKDLFKLGCQSAYVELRAQAAICGQLSHQILGRRKITDMCMGERGAYLVLAPMG